MTTAAYLTMIGEFVTEFLKWFAQVATSLMSSAILPFIVIGIGVSVVGIAFKWLRRMMWGN